MADYALNQGTGPLRGIKVVEIAGIGPGPHAATILADLGRRRDPGREARRRRQRRAPRDRPADPRPAQRGAGPEEPRRAAPRCMELIEGADVLLEGMRPGVTERLGIGPDACLERNPRLVYGRMTGWGQTGPWATTAGHDMNYIAVSGVLHGFGQDRDRPALPQQRGRRLRRRVDVPRDRGARRAAGGAHQRPRPGRRRRHRRRLGAPEPDVGLDAGRPASAPSSARATCSTAASPTTRSTPPPTAST